MQKYPRTPEAHDRCMHKLNEICREKYAYRENLLIQYNHMKGHNTHRVSSWMLCYKQKAFQH